MSEKILIADDDPNATRFAQFVLEQKGYQVVTASNGLEGLNKVAEEKPDLVILDIMLPGMDGFQICRRLRAAESTARLPILMLSGKARESDRESGLKVGADEYLTKPASPADLTNAVQKLLAKDNEV